MVLMEAQGSTLVVTAHRKLTYPLASTDLTPSSLTDQFRGRNMNVVHVRRRTHTSCVLQTPAILAGRGVSYSPDVGVWFRSLEATRKEERNNKRLTRGSVGMREWNCFLPLRRCERDTPSSGLYCSRPPRLPNPWGRAPEPCPRLPRGYSRWCPTLRCMPQNSCLEPKSWWESGRSML